MNKSNLILASVSAIIFTSILIIFSPNSQKTSLSSTTPSPVSTESISPTPDPTADWKTYENEEYGFSFQYDDTKHLLENISVDQESISSYSQYFDLNLKPDVLVLWKGLKAEAIPEESITMHFNPAQLFAVQIFNNTLSPEEFAKRRCGSEYGPDYLKSSGFKKINANGQTFYYFNSGGIGNGTFHYVFFNKNTIVSFNTSESLITYETNLEFAQILSTFKFYKL